MAVLILSGNTLCNPFLCKQGVHGSGENYTVGCATELPPAFRMEYDLQPLTGQLELYAVAFPCCTAGYAPPMARADTFCLTDVPAAVSVKQGTHVLIVRGCGPPAKRAAGRKLQTRAAVLAGHIQPTGRKRSISLTWCRNKSLRTIV